MSSFSILGDFNILPVFTNLLFILGFLFLSAIILNLLRKRSLFPKSSPSPSSSILIVATRSLNWRSSLFVIKTQESYFLVACGRTGVTAIERCTGQTTVDFRDHQ